ncbi:MAG: HEAT repeat domain-containing protein [Sedimentisphaerales bacterium]|nr:HEAT repeat domain-containing protein [Sedimentisphaerales bacterium]
MRIPAKELTALLLVWLCVNSALINNSGAAFNKSEIDEKLAAIVNYERGMSREPLIAVEKLIRESQNQPEQRKYIELKLAELLPEATLESKSFICRQLWFVGTADSVPAIAKLLMDEETADIACYAIGQNPSDEAGKALREALKKVSPTVQIRIINLLGDRGDNQSVEAIGKLVSGREREVSEAAVAALGKIGGARAIQLLVESRAKGDSELRFAATDAYLRCAEDLMFDGETKQATIIYNELAGKNETPIIRSAAIKGLADIGGQDIVPLVIAALRDENRMVRTTARSCVRTMEGSGVTEQIASELSKTSPDEQMLLIGALADRGDAAALPAITEAAKSTNPEIRKAVLAAVGKLGDASFVEYLVKSAAEGLSSEEKRLAVKSLTLLRGSRVDDAIVQSMQNSEATIRQQLIQVLGERNAVDAVPALLKEAGHQDRKVSQAAFKTLGKLAEEKHLPSLIKLLTNTEDSSSRRTAERAVVAVSRKISQPDKQSDAILAELRSEESVAVRCSLLRVLGGIANSKALITLEAASKEANPLVQDTSVRTLAKWPNAAGAEVLLDIYCNTKSPIHRLLALRGFVRLLSLPVQGRTAEKTLELYRRAMQEAKSSAEQKLVLSGLSNVSNPEALRTVEPFLQAEEVKGEAAMAAIKIAKAIMETHGERAKTAMNKLLAISNDENLRRQAEEIIRQIK